MSKHKYDSFYETMPKEVRVGYLFFKIEVRDNEDHEAEGTFGHMNVISQKIRIKPDMNPQNLANTFIHEVMHAINMNMGVLGKEGDEEMFVEMMANGICMFWQDNPEACEWWEKTLKARI